MKAPTLEIPMPKLAPKDLAALFWSMGDDEQAAFFDELGAIVLTTPEPFSHKIGSMGALDMQMCYTSDKCTPLGRDAMSRIGMMGTKILKP